MKNVILIAAPAAGKGTEAALLKEEYKINEKFIDYFLRLSKGFCELNTFFITVDIGMNCAWQVFFFNVVKSKIWFFRYKIFRGWKFIFIYKFFYHYNNAKRTISKN